MISAIIPIYNTPKDYIERCVNSIFKQSYKEYEIIIVNDGSDRDTCDFLKDKFETIDKIRIIEKDNQGVSSARNRGIESAKGEYLTFIDADDTLDPKFFKEAIDLADKYNADMVAGSFKIKPGGLVKLCDRLCVLNTKDKVTSAVKALLGVPQSDIDLDDRNDPLAVLGAPCGRLYKSDLLRKSRFKEDVQYYEDQLFNREVLRNCRSIILSPETWYIYYQNEFSAMHHIGPDYMNAMLYFWKYWDEQNNNEDDVGLKLGGYLYALRWFFITSMKGIIRQPWTFKKQMAAMADLLEEPMISNAVSYITIHSCFTKKQKAQYVLLKSKNVLAIYIYQKIYYKLFKPE